MAVAPTFLAESFSFATGALNSRHCWTMDTRS
jgi:hypothetical protein